MKKENKKEILLLPAPKTPSSAMAPNTADTALGDADATARKYGENTGRDPVTGRFLAGNSGKPLGTQHFSTLFKKVIRQTGGMAKDGQKVSYDEIMVKKIVIMATDGNLKAATMVMDRVDGTVRQGLDITSGGERVEGTVVLTAEEDERIGRLFRRKKVEEKEHIKENGNNKQKTDAPDGQGDRGGDAVPEAKPERSAYERS